MPTVVKRVTEPASQPVTLAEAKLHLRVAFDDDDALITRQIKTARRLCEAAGKLVAINTTFDLVLDGFPNDTGSIAWMIRRGFTPATQLANNSAEIVLPRQPLVSVTSITYLDVNGSSQTLSSTDYVVATGNPGRIAPAYGLPWPVTYPQIGALTVRFVAGYGSTSASVPDNVIDAILVTLSDLYDRRTDYSDGKHAILPTAAAAFLGIETQGGYA